MKFDPLITLETERLILRYLRVSDTHDIFININHDKDVLKYFIDKYRENECEMTLDRTIEYCLDNNRYLFGIELKTTHEVIGVILQCSTPDKVFNTTEIGFAVGKKYWNQGYTSEAFRKMIEFMFSLDIHKVCASHIVDNNASKRVIEKCGLTYEGRKKEEVYYHNQYHDVDYYFIINPQNDGN